jgi:hypothetical protein
VCGLTAISHPNGKANASDIVRIASDGHTITVSQATNNPGALTAGQQALVDALPSGATYRVLGSGFNTVLRIQMPAYWGTKLAPGVTGGAAAGAAKKKN